MTFFIKEEDWLAHYGILRKSGRYPWGSGGPEVASNKSFIEYVAQLRGQGLTESEIAKAMGIESTTALRAANTIAKAEQKAADISAAQRYKEHGLSNVAIGEKMGINESSVRSLLSAGAADKAQNLTAVSDMLKTEVDKGGFVDIGVGVETHIGVSKEKLGAAVAILKEQGYEVHRVQVDQLGTSNKTTLKVLCPPGTKYPDVAKNKDQIRQINQHSEDGGRSFLGLRPVNSISLDRVAVRYAEQGGTDADGVIYVRPGAKDLDLGGARYAQVRIGVNGTHYLKGMAMYKDDLPDGVDLMFNTNKSDKGDKLKAMKEMKKTPDGKIDVDNPFGSAIKPGGQRGHMNIVNEEGDWEGWSRNFSSQMLSKQTPQLAAAQLGVTFDNKKADLDDIMALTNPAVKKKLLEAYADGADSAAVHLKAAALPRSSSHVILPINTMKETEVYAPNFENGERVALVRYPHGGIFEIPELTVNNNHPPAKKAIGRARDAIGINSKVAERLSGADFDGDTVLVIPNNRGQIKTKPPLQKLIGFDPQARYPAYEGMPKMSARTKGMQMGLVSNLITDMTIKGASDAELARAVAHSMVVIDAEKHNLNYKQSAKDHGIGALMKKYQDRTAGGSSTLISRATARTDVRARKNTPLVDRETGKKIWVETGESWQNAKGETKYAMQRSVKLAETDDARTLVSGNGGTKIERVYADHSNKLKDLANKARLETTKIRPQRYSPDAKKAFAPQVESLNAKLNLALRNKPLERQAQLIANTVVQAKKDANPDLEKAEIKKLSGMALQEARNRTGAEKQKFDLTPDEWSAIQAGAITNHKLEQILDNADLDRIRELATPRTSLKMTPSKVSRAKQMASLGYTQAEIAGALGVSLTTLKTEI